MMPRKAVEFQPFRSWAVNADLNHLWWTVDWEPAGVSLPEWSPVRHEDQTGLLMRHFTLDSLESLHTHTHFIMYQIVVKILFLSIYQKFYAVMWHSCCGLWGREVIAPQKTPAFFFIFFLGLSTLLLVFFFVCAACLEQTQFSFGSLLSTDRPGGERWLFT